MRNINFFEPNLHACIITMTGGGKTTLGEKIFSNLEHRAIFIDFQYEEVFEKYRPKRSPGAFITDVNLLDEAMHSDSKVVFRTKNISQITTMVDYIFESKFKIKAFAETPIYLFFDEIQKYSQIQIIEDVFNMGRRWNVHGVFMVRQIQEMKNLRIVSECDEMIFLKLNDIGQRTLRNNYGIKIPPEILTKINSGERNEKDKLVSNFNSVLYDKFSWMLFDKDGEFIGEFNAANGEIKNVENSESQDKKVNDERPAQKFQKGS